MTAATDKPSLRWVVDDFALYLRDNPAWGALHIVLDDGNVRDADVDACIRYAEEAGDMEGAELARVLRRMSKTQRRKLPALAEARAPVVRRMTSEERVAMIDDATRRDWLEQQMRAAFAEARARFAAAGPDRVVTASDATAAVERRLAALATAGDLAMLPEVVSVVCARCKRIVTVVGHDPPTKEALAEEHEGECTA